MQSFQHSALRRTALLTGPILALASAASAQSIATSYTTPTGMSATAYYSSLGSKQKTAPKNANLKSGLSLSASSGLGRASTSVSFSQDTKDRISIRIAESASGRYYSFSSRATGYTGAHQTLLTLTPKKARSGTLTLSWSITARYFGRASGSVDIGANKRWEFSGSTTALKKSIHVSVPMTGLKILTQTYSSASSSSSSARSPYVYATLTVLFTPDEDPCRFTAYGQYCQPILLGKSTPQGQIEMTCGSASPSSPVLLMIGGSSLSLKVPGTSCYLLTSPSVLLTGLAGPSGTSLFQFAAPPRPARLYTQAASIDLKALAITTSNGIRIDC